jgi:hypothetical protein
VKALAVLASAAVVAVPLPGTKTAADRKAWRAILHWPAGCENVWRATRVPGAGIVASRAPGGRGLVEVTCALGAYQGTEMLYLVRGDRRTVGPLALLTYVDPGNGKPEPRRLTVILGVFSWSPRTGELTVFDKFRGPGDCGIFSRFRLVGDRFRTLEVRAKTACDGKPPYDPTRWPRLPTP